MRIPEIGTVVAQAERAEGLGWDGITFTDSQNLVGDPFVAIALAATATDRLRFATGVTNAFTRHPAALANVAATVQETTGGRFVLGIGRGDTAMFHLGAKPMPVAQFIAAVTDLQTYLSNETLDCGGRPSRLQFLDRCRQPKVPLDIAASGPRMIEFAARIAEHVTLAVGADPDRVAWAIDLARKAAADAGRDPSSISFGAYVNVGCHPDLDAARSSSAGAVAAFAHFSSMPGSTGAGLAEADRAVVAEVGRTYDSNEHLSNAAAHTAALKPEFVDRFAVVGPPDACSIRLRDLAGLGLERFVITGASFRSDAEHRRTSEQLLTGELLPRLRERSDSEYEHARLDHPRRHRRRRHRRARAHGRCRDRRRCDHRGRQDRWRRARTIDADGLLVTPGFVDIHAHYDGQASWGERMIPSSWHGVTTVVVGNCGVGFAPVRPADHQRLIELMEGVEDIPGHGPARGSRLELAVVSPSSWTRSTVGRSTSTSRFRCRTARCGCT